MSILNNTFFQISFFTTIYLLIMIIVSPIIDHIFTSIDEDIIVKESKLQVFGEIIGQVITIAIVWHTINLYVSKYFEKKFALKIKPATVIAIGFISSAVVLGLQNNLIDKLKYITINHPFRLTDLYK